MVVMPKGRFFLLPATFFFKSASNEETSKLQHYEFTVVLLYNICCGGDCSAFGFRQVQNYKIQAVALLHIHCRLYPCMLGNL